MRFVVMFCILATIVPAIAAPDDAKPIIQRQLQDMMDAIVPGDAEVWNRYLDPACLYVEEDDTIKTKADMLKELTPFPKGISGTIKVEVLRFHRDGDIAVAVVREHERENYFGQALHPADYLSTTTWRREKGGWKLISGQVLAELIDPPAVHLPASQLNDYAGRYQLKDAKLVYTIAMEGTKLMGGRAGKAPVELNAEVRDVFFVAGQPRTRKIFLREASGRIIGFADRREGRDLIWAKLP